MYERELLWIISSIEDKIRARPLFLGGYSGPVGGVGGPPGGFIGHLPQHRVAFDTTEAEDCNIPSSGANLVHNLNRIRCRLRKVENDVITISGQISTGSGVNVNMVNVGVGRDVYYSGTSNPYEFRRITGDTGITVIYDTDTKTNDTIKIRGYNLVGEVTEPIVPGVSIIKYFGNPAPDQPRHLTLKKLRSTDNSIQITDYSNFIDFRANVISGADNGEKKYLSLACSGTLSYTSSVPDETVDFNIQVSGCVNSPVKDLIPFIRVHSQNDNSSVISHTYAEVLSVWFSRSDGSENENDTPEKLNIRVRFKQGSVDYNIKWYIFERSIDPGLYFIKHYYTWQSITGGEGDIVFFLSDNIAVKNLIPIVKVGIRRDGDVFTLPLSVDLQPRKTLFTRADNSQDENLPPEMLRIYVASDNTGTQNVYAKLTLLSTEYVDGAKAVEIIDFIEDYESTTSSTIEQESIQFPFVDEIWNVFSIRRYSSVPDNTSIENLGGAYSRSYKIERQTIFRRKTYDNTYKRPPDSVIVTSSVEHGSSYNDIYSFAYFLKAGEPLSKIVNGENTGTGAGVFRSIENNVIKLRSIKNTDGLLSVYNTYDEVIIDNNALVHGAVNVGSGTGIFRAKNNNVLEFKTLVASGCLNINETSETVIISCESAGSSGGCGTFISEVFTVSGNTYTLSNTPSGSVQVFVDTTIQYPDTYTVSGNQVIFNTTPTGSRILVWYITCVAGGGYGIGAYGQSAYGN